MKVNNKEVSIITRPCPFCGHAHEVEVNEADYWDWEDGELVQVAFPYLSADERELLISGICPDCWNRTFGSDEEPDPDEVDIHGNTFGGKENEGETLDEALHQFGIDVLSAIFGGEKPMEED